MPKKSRRASNGGIAARPTPRPTPTSTPTTPPPGGQQGDEPGWRRMKRSLIGMLLIAGFAMMDPLILKEGITVVLPDHKALLALVVLFWWLVWKRWVSSDKRGMHPFFRTVGFVAVLAGCLAVLPFNSTVTMLEVPLLTADECRAVAHATAEAVSIPGFVPSISVFDPDTEVPVQDLPDEIAAMVSAALEKKMMPFVTLEYGGLGEVTLDKRLYVEHHQPDHELSLPAHVRRGQLSFRVELNPPESKYVGGGGVFLGSMGRTITPGLGSGLVLPAKLRHSSSQPGPRERSVLVGSLTIKGRDPWQRFVGMWWLWGLFSRRVRYIADRRLSSSGVDNIPAPEPEPGTEEAVAVEEL
ncbi:unnamed protein product [Pylaiella littoralis]